MNCPNCKNVETTKLDGYNPPVFNCALCGGTFMEKPKSNPPYRIMVFSGEGGYPKEWVNVGSETTKEKAMQQAKQYESKMGENVVVQHEGKIVWEGKGKPNPHDDMVEWWDLGMTPPERAQKAEIIGIPNKDYDDLTADEKKKLKEWSDTPPDTSDEDAEREVEMLGSHHTEMHGHTEQNPPAIVAASISKSLIKEYLAAEEAHHKHFGMFDELSGYSSDEGYNIHLVQKWLDAKVQEYESEHPGKPVSKEHLESYLREIIRMTKDATAKNVHFGLEPDEYYYELDEHLDKELQALAQNPRWDATYGEDADIKAAHEAKEEKKAFAKAEEEQRPNPRPDYGTSAHYAEQESARREDEAEARLQQGGGGYDYPDCPKCNTEMTWDGEDMVCPSCQHKLSHSNPKHLEYVKYKGWFEVEDAPAKSTVEEKPKETTASTEVKTSNRPFSFTNWVSTDGMTKAVLITHKPNEIARKAAERGIRGAISGVPLEISAYDEKGLKGYEIAIPGGVAPEILKKAEDAALKYISDALQGEKDYVFKP